MATGAMAAAAVVAAGRQAEGFAVAESAAVAAAAIVAGARAQGPAGALVATSEQSQHCNKRGLTNRTASALAS